MLQHRKFISHYIWIVFACIVGLGIGYVTTKGGALAVDSIVENIIALVPFDNSPVYKNTRESLAESEQNLEKALPAFPGTEGSLSIGFVGDIIPGISPSKNIFSEVSPYTDNPDIMIGNFEGVVSESIYSKCAPGSLNCFSFNGDYNFLNLLSDASFDVLNVANNHFNDFGEDGQRDTINAIEQAGIVVSGVKNKISYVNKNGFKVAIVGFSTYLWTNDMDNTRNLKKIITEAKQNSDIVVVVFHGGGEGIKYAHTPYDTESYLGENRGNVRNFAHNAIDAGANVVFGSGPHVLRGIEKYNGKLIAYSLGNFAAQNRVLTSGTLKNSAMIDVTFNKKGHLINGTVFPFDIDGLGIPHPGVDSINISTINSLSKEDFGEQGVTVDTFGSIVLK